MHCRHGLAHNDGWMWPSMREGNRKERRCTRERKSIQPEGSHFVRLISDQSRKAFGMGVYRTSYVLIILAFTSVPSNVPILRTASRRVHSGFDTDVVQPCRSLHTLQTIMDLQGSAWLILIHWDGRGNLVARETLFENAC